MAPSCDRPNDVTARSKVAPGICVLVALLALGAPTNAWAQSAAKSAAQQTSDKPPRVDDVADAPSQPDNPPGRADQQDWWTPWYLVDYSLIAAGATAFVIGEGMQPADEALIGPTYDPNHPDKLFDAPAISQPYLREGNGETIPKEWVIAAIGGAGVYLGALEAVSWRDGTGSPRQFHDTMIGFLEAVALTAGTTNLVKPTVGRLRPDFADRARRYLCSTDDPQRLDCQGYRDASLANDPAAADKLFMDGRRSFFSGHSSNSFAVFTYTSLVVGGHYVWGERATPRSRAAGIAAQSVMMGAATFIAASRVIDGRHHPTDVLAGGATGFFFANFAYWRRFDARGRPYSLYDDEDDFAFEVGPAPRGVGVQLTVRHR